MLRSYDVSDFSRLLEKTAGELLALRWRCIDLKARLLRVCETVYDGHFDRSKTKRSARTIPIGIETAEILSPLLLTAVDPKALVFATREELPVCVRASHG